MNGVESYSQRPLTIGVEGANVVMYTDAGASWFKVTMGPDAARRYARQLQAMADLIDTMGLAPKPAAEEGSKVL